jgi:hypothetical protein
MSGSTTGKGFGTVIGPVLCHLVANHAALTMPATGTPARWQNQPKTATG